MRTLGSVIYGLATGPEDFLEHAYQERGMVTLGVLIELVAVMAIPLIGFFMFPVLKRFNEALALAYAGFRSLEAVFVIPLPLDELAFGLWLIFKGFDAETWRKS